MKKNAKRERERERKTEDGMRAGGRTSKEANIAMSN